MVKQYMRTTANWHGGKFMKFEEILKQGKKQWKMNRKNGGLIFLTKLKQ